MVTLKLDGHPNVRWSAPNSGTGDLLSSWTPMVTRKEYGAEKNVILCRWAMRRQNICYIHVPLSLHVSKQINNI